MTSLRDIAGVHGLIFGTISVDDAQWKDNTTAKFKQPNVSSYCRRLKRVRSMRCKGARADLMQKEMRLNNLLKFVVEGLVAVPKIPSCSPR